MQYTINQLYDHLHIEVTNIYDIFKGFFSEEHVDLQPWRSEADFKMLLKQDIESLHINPIDTTKHEFDAPYEISDIILQNLKDYYALKKSTIYVWWPRLTVTNENNKSIVIHDLYAKIEIQFNGRIPYENIGFRLNRATYTKEQFLSDYMFSHIKGIPKGNLNSFLSPCLGTGPLKGTISTLKNDYDEITWMLFCQELSMYVTVESLKGVPWRHLEEVGAYKRLTSHTGYDFKVANITQFYSIFNVDTLKDFIKHYLEHGHLSLSYKHGKFTVGMLYHEYIIDVSNAFIDYYNSRLKKDRSLLNSCFYNDLLCRTILSNGIFYKEIRTDVPDAYLDEYRDKFVLRFKGVDIKTTIFSSHRDESVLTIIINNDVAMYILENILRTINFRFTNEHNSKTNRDKKETPAYQRVRYI